MRIRILEFYLKKILLFDSGPTGPGRAGPGRAGIINTWFWKHSL